MFLLTRGSRQPVPKCQPPQRFESTATPRNSPFSVFPYPKPFPPKDCYRPPSRPPLHGNLARFQWAFGIFLFVTFLNNWTFLPYRRVQETRLGVLECIHRIRTGENPGQMCERDSSAKLGPSLEAADRLRLSFTRPRP